MDMKKRIVSLIALWAMLLQLCMPAVAVSAESVSLNGGSSVGSDVLTEPEDPGPSSGQVDNMAWTVTENYYGTILRLSGEGEMPLLVETIPWEGYKNVITWVIVEEGLTSVSDGMFYGYPALSTVDLPHGLTRVGDGAFAGTSITKLVVPATVTEFAAGAVDDCAQLTDLYFYGDKPDMGGSEISLSNGTARYASVASGWENTAGAQRFYGYGGHRYEFAPTTCTFPDAESAARDKGGHVLTITSLGEEMYLRSIASTLTMWLGAYMEPMGGIWSWSSGCDEWNDYCFARQPYDVSDPYSAYLYVDTDGTWQVSDGTDHFSLVIEYEDYEGLDPLTWTFDEETGKLTVYGEGEMPEYEMDFDSGHPLTGAPWAEHSSDIRTLEITQGITSVSTGAFAGCWKLETIILPDGLTVIGDDAFTGAGVKYVKQSIPMGMGFVVDGFPSTVTVIGDRAFYGYSGLTEVDLANTWVEEIGEDAFGWQQDVVTVTLPDGLTTIGDRAFTGCAMSGVVLPASLTSMGSDAFSGNAELTDLYFCGSRPFEELTTDRTEGTVIHCMTLDDSWKSFTHNGATVEAAEFPTYDGHPVLYVAGSYTFAQAGSLARMMGGWPAAVTDGEENGFLAALIPDGVTNAWIGATYAGDGWIWTSGDTFSYTNWADNITSQNGQSAAMGGNGLWYSCLQEEKRPVLVEFPVPVSTTIVTVEINGITVTFDKSIGLVMSCFGTAENFVMPGSIDGVPVTEVARNAFAGCSLSGVLDLSLTSLTGITGLCMSQTGLEALSLPATVTFLMDDTFYNCPALERVIFNGSAPTLSTESDDGHQVTHEYFAPNVVFYYVDGKEGWTAAHWNGVPALPLSGEGYLKADGGDVTLLVDRQGTVVSYIGSGAGIVIPQSVGDVTVTGLGDRLFYGDTAVTELHVPATVTSIGELAFFGTENLLIAVFEGDAPTNVADTAFDNASPDLVIHCPEDGEGWTNPWHGVNTTLPAEDIVFFDVPGGQLIFDRVTGTVTGYTGSPTVVVVPAEIAGTAVRAIADGAMKGASDLSSMDLSATAITATGADIWDDCTDLVRLVLPATVASVDLSALSNCTSCLHFIFTGNAPTVDGFGSDWKLAKDYTLWFPETAALGDLDGFPFVKRYAPIFVEGGTLMLDDSTDLIVGYLGSPVELELASDMGGFAVDGVGAFAFESCLSLEQVSFSAGMTRLDVSVFHNCEYLLSADLTGLEITALPEKVFHNCLRVEEIFLPEGITSIGSFCFNDCNALKSIAIPSTVTTVYDGAFYKCNTLETLVFPAALTYLAAYAIPYCANLKTVDLSLTSITRLDVQTFTECPALEEVYLPGTLTEVSASAFLACTEVKSLYFMGDAPTATGDMSGYLPNATAYYQPSASGWSDTWYGLPTEQDPTWAFCDVVGGQIIFNTRTGEITGYTGEPTVVIVPAEIGGVAVTGIAPSAFAGCYTLRVMDLSETSVTSVRPAVWDGCYDLLRLVLPDTLQEFERSALEGCDSLEHIIFLGSMPAYAEELLAPLPGSCVMWHPEGVDGWQIGQAFIPLPVPGGTLVYDSENSLIAAHYGRPTELTDPELPAAGIGANAFAYAYALQTVTLPAAVESVGAGAFRGCTGLQTADLSATAVIELNDQLFQNCASMTNVYLPETLLSINYGVFGGCSALSMLILPDELTFIGARAFANCSALGYLDFPASLAQIVGSAFVGCSNLKKLTFAGNAPNVMPPNVPAGQLSTYIPDAVVYYMEFTSGWSDPFSGLKAVSYPNPYMVRYAVPGGSLLFDKRSGLIVGYEGAPTSVRLPSAIENVMVNGFAAAALKDCASLVWADLGDISMFTLPGGLFVNCSALTDVILPPQISTLVGTAFGGCSALERIMFTGPAPENPDSIARNLSSVAPNAVIYFPEEYSDSWTTPLWHANTAYPYASREGDVSWPFPGGTLFFNEDSGALVGCSLYRRHILIPETVLGQEVVSIAADAFAGHSFVRMFFLGKAPGEMDLTGCPADMAIYYPVADADLWEDSVQGFAARPYSPAEALVSHTVTGGAILLDPANGLISGFTGDPTQILVPASVSGHAVTGVRGDAFEGAEHLELVILPNSVTYVESDAFADCDADLYGPGELGLTPLKVTATEPVNSSTVGGDSFILKVTTNIPYAMPVILSDGMITNSANGVYTFRVDLTALEEGEYTNTFAVTCADYGLSHEITLFVDRKAPTTPANFRAEAGVLANTLYWEQSPEANVALYRVWIEGERGLEILAELRDKTALSYTHFGLTAGEEYTYAVSAVDIYGQESDLSPVSSATPKPDEVPPVILSVSHKNGSTLTGTVALTVEAEDNIGLASVTVMVSNEPTPENWQLLETLTFENVTAGSAAFRLDTTVYSDDNPLYVLVTAADIYGNEGQANAVFAYALDNTPPEQVTGLHAESTTTVITLNWEDVAARDFAEFQVEQMMEGEWERVGTTSTALGIQVTGLTPATLYTFRVRAVDKCGNEGEWSEEFSASTLADVYPPVITAINPAPGYYSGAIPMRFSAHDDFGIASWLVQVSYDGEEWHDVGEVESRSTSIYYELETAELAEGSIFVRAVVTDRYGNVSNTGSDAPCNQYIIDRTAPADPTGVAITAGDGYLAVTWEKGSEADLHTYSIWRSATGEEGTFSLLQGNLQQLYWRDSAVEYGNTYYYYVTVRDQAGNVSGRSATVSGEPLDDSKPPQVVSISPSEGYVLGKDTAIRVRLYDNNKVTALYWQVNEGAVRSIAVDMNDGVVELPLDLAAMASGDFTLTVWCVDAVGLESEPVGRSYSLDLTAPAQTVVTAEAAPLSVELSWQGVTDADLAGYQVYRSVNGGEWIRLTQRSAGQDSYTYTDSDLQPTSTYSYYVRTLDTHGNYADGPACEAVSPIDRDVIAPSAILDGSTSGIVGVELAFSAKRSTDNRGIASYEWSFGDGSTSTLMEPVHSYAAVGTYTVTLTVTDTSGNKTAAHYQVKVEEPSRVGQLTVTVVDENGTPVPSAGVWLDLGEDDQSVVYTNGAGQVSVSLPAGSHVIGAYLDGYLPARETVNITAGIGSRLRLVTVKKDIVVGELTVERMTLEEIIAAGIDVTDPANQQVFHFTIHLTYGEYEALIDTMYNGEGEVLVDPEPIRILDPDDEEREVTVTIVPIGGGGISGPVGGGGWGGDEPDTPLVVVLDIPGTASWLKDFFEVHLTVFNQADREFALDNCNAYLNVPSGLTLMDTAITTADPSQSMGTIYGQSSGEATWIIRGDKGGDYDLTADFSAILRDFDRPVNAQFKTARPFHVREGDGLTLEVVVENAIMADADGAVRVGLRNDDPDPYYLPNIALDPTLVELIQSFKTAGYVTLDTGMDELKTGETIWWDYIVPRANWDLLMPKEGEAEKDFYLLNAIVEATGGVEPPCNITEVLPFTISPDLIEVSRLYDSGEEGAISYVNLAKSGVSGGTVPTLRIRTYRLNPVTGEYEPTSMQINVKDEHLMKNGGMDETNGLTVTTNSEGYYDLSGYELKTLNNDKTYNIRISSRRAQAVEIPVVLRGKTAAVGRVNVYVYTIDDKGEIKPLKDATVTLTGHDVSDKTDREGLAKFKYVDQGYQEIVVSMDGYIPVTDLVTVGEDSEFTYRLIADDDPNASRVLSVTTNLTQWTSGNQVIFPEGRVTGDIYFRLTRRVAEGETFRRYLYRIVRDGAVAEEGGFTSDAGFRLEASRLKEGDKVQFAVETTAKSGLLSTSSYTDSGIVVTGVPGFFGELVYNLSNLTTGTFLDTGKCFDYHSDSVFSEETFQINKPAGGVKPQDDKDGKQDAVISEVNKGSFQKVTKQKLVPVQAKYEMSGKLTLSVIMGNSTLTESQGAERHVTKVATPTSFESSVSYKRDPLAKENRATGMFRLDFILQYNPGRNDWDLLVQGTVAAEQEITFKTPTKVLLLSVGLKTRESATLNLYESGVGPSDESGLFASATLFDKAALAGELKGAAGVKAGSEKIASADVYLKLGLDFEFLPDLILTASAALGVEGNVLIWGGEKDLISDNWTFSGEAKPANLSSIIGADNSVLSAVRGSSVTALGGGDTVVADIFGSADPQLVTLSDGRVLMVWCGYTGDAGAPVGLYWATWDGAVWSDPALVESDGTADLYPAMIAVDGKTHLVWVDFTESVPANMNDLTLDEIRNYAFSRLGVSYAVFTGDGWTASDLYEGGSIAAMPQVAAAPDGRVMVAWVGNEGNLQIADAESHDMVCWLLLENGKITDTGAVAVPSTAVYDLALGFANGFRMGILADTADGRIRVHQTRYTAAGWLEPAEAGNVTGEDSTVTMSPDGKLYFINSGRLYCYEGGHLIHLLQHDLLAEGSNRLTWAETETGGVLLWTVTVDNRSTLCAVSVTDSGEAGSPVVITDAEEGALTCVAAARLGDELTVISARNRREQDLWLRDLTRSTCSLGVDLSLTDGQVFHSGYLIPGVAMETMVSPVSLGLADPGSFTASVVTADGEILATAQGGTGLTATVQWAVPADYSGETLYVTVTADGDLNSANDSVAMTNEVVDLALSDLVHVGRMDGVDIFTVRVTNEGLVPVEGATFTVSLVEGSELLRSAMPTVTVPTLEPGASADVRVELTLDRSVDCPLVFRLDGGDGDVTNDAASLVLHPEEPEVRKETVVAFRGWTQEDGKASTSWEVDSRLGDGGTYQVMVASYDEDGRMLDCAFVTVEVAAGSLQTVSASVAEGHTVRAYLMDGGWTPLDDCRTLGE